MSAAENKRLLTEAFVALGTGDTRPYLALLDDDFTFTITGHNPWSRTIRGKDNVRAELWGPLFELFADRYTAQLVDVIVDGDTAVVEYHGCVTTKRGDLYNNQYCLVLGMKDGRIRSLKEYACSYHVEQVLGGPAWAKTPVEA